MLITFGPEFPLGARTGSYHVLTTSAGRYELYRLRYSIFGGGTSWVHQTS